jgi:hypothetical protein
MIEPKENFFKFVQNFSDDVKSHISKEGINENDFCIIAYKIDKESMNRKELFIYKNIEEFNKKVFEHFCKLYTFPKAYGFAIHSFD